MDLDGRRAFFESLAEVWDSQQLPNRGEVLRRMLAPYAAELRVAKAILEVGTGTGALIPLLQASATAARLISIDMAGAMLQHARRRCPDALLVQCDVHRLPFASGSIESGFDWVICHNSFPHFEDPFSAAADMARVLCRGGHLLIVHDLGREQVNAIHRGIPNRFVKDDLLPGGVELAGMLARRGFTILQVEDSASRYAVHAQMPECSS
jgi:ubiquinone/menaquinone biosynthesis C-methylase UbiE